jgi:hypothetical protein
MKLTVASFIIHYLNWQSPIRTSEAFAGAKGIYRQEWRSRAPIALSVMLRVSDDPAEARWRYFP